MAYRVIQWATGNVGRSSRSRASSRTPSSSWSAPGCTAPDKVGRDVGELCGLGPIGVVASDDEDASSRSTPTASSTARAPEHVAGRAHPRVGQERRHAGRLDLSLRVRRRRARSRRRAGRRASTLHGTGIHPGGITERFPAHALGALEPASGTCARRSSPTSATTRPSSWCARSCCSGRRRKLRRRARCSDSSGDGFGQSIDMVAAGLGSTLDPEKRTTHEMAVATGADRHPGRAHRARHRRRAAVHVARNASPGEPVITVRVNWLMGERAPRSAVELRSGRALRGRVRRRAAGARHVPRSAPARIRRATSTATRGSPPPPCTA